MKESNPVAGGTATLGRALRALLLLALGLSCSGCVWLQNEFFVYDVPPPAPEEPGRGESTW